MSIYNIDDYKPHTVINYNGKTFVTPVKLFEKVLEGKMNITDIEGWEDMVKGIIKDWIS